MIELGLLIAMLSPHQSIEMKWCRIRAAGILRHAEGRPGHTAHQICTELFQRTPADYYIDDDEREDCYEYLWLCPAALPK